MICEICGKEFEKNKYANKATKYCSKKCGGKASYKTKLEKHPYIPKERPEIGIIMKCEVCGNEFEQNPKYRQGVQKYCSVNCQAKFWRDSNPDKVKEINRKYRKSNPEKVALKQRRCSLKRKYGITLDDYNSMLEAQGGRCAICGEEKAETLSVDHDHETGKVRGLLCAHCNHVVGFARDKIELLESTIRYLTDN